MKLVEQKIHEFTAELASDSPAPGGGSASAYMGAQGSALAAMVCTLTLIKAKYAEHHALAEETRAKAEDLRKRFLDVIDQDTEAFLVVSNAYGMPKATDEEKAERSAAIQAGLLLCTKTPLLMMEMAVEALELIDGLLGKFNENAASDLGVAALSLRSCVQGAWLNVLINVGSLKDRDQAENCRKQGESLLNKAMTLADGAYNHIVGIL